MGAAAAQPPSEAWARAWAADFDAARRLASREPEGTRLGVLGAVAMLERRSEEALSLLNRAMSLGGDEDLVLLRARALVHLHRLEEARRSLSSLGDGESFARRAIIALVSLRSGHNERDFAKWLRRVATSETHLNGFYAHELPAVVGREELERAFRGPRELADLLERLLDRMAGNLGRVSTVSEIGPGGERRFVPLAVQTSTRELCVEALHSLRRVGPANAEAALTALRVRYPRSVHPLCYRGELHLWLGRYDEAWRDFVAARWMAPARWAHIGLLAVLVLTGRHRRARLAAAYAERRDDFIPGGTLPVYRGVLRRRTGDLQGAIADLGAAVAAKPTRVGARMELVLALRAAGQHAEAAEHAAVVVRDATPALVDAAAALGRPARREPALAGDEILEEALRAMRGNRSSSIVTWLDRRGNLHVMEPRAGLERSGEAGQRTIM